MNREVCGICWCPYDDNGACGCEPQTGATMNREDIIRMAREAGWTSYDSQDERFERFAELARADEREACAKVCDDKAKETFSGQCQVWGEHFARAIRARGNT